MFYDFASFSFGVVAEVFGKPDSFSKVIRTKESASNFIYLEETWKGGRGTHITSLSEPRTGSPGQSLALSCLPQHL